MKGGDSMIIATATIILFTITYVLLNYRLIKSINLKRPTKMELFLIIFSGITYVLVMKSVLQCFFTSLR